MGRGPTGRANHLEVHGNKCVLCVHLYLHFNTYIRYDHEARKGLHAPPLGQFGVEGFVRFKDRNGYGNHTWNLGFVLEVAAEIEG